MIETIAIGDELLDGRIVDSNTKDLGDALAVFGLTVSRATIVPDERDRIVDAVREAAGRADVVVTSGGLGPTTDDVTAECVAVAAGVGMRTDAAAQQRIRDLFASRGFPMSENNLRQAVLPEGSRTLQNDEGTAPGFVTPVGGAEIWSFPGVPREYRHLLDVHLLTALRARAGVQGVVVKTAIRCLGVTESALGAKLADFEAAHPDVKVQYRTTFPENHARLVVSGDDAAARSQALVAEAVAAIGRSAYAVGDAPLEQRVIEALARRGETIACAESCTGGLVAKRLTDVPGSSAVVRGGVVAYANEAKTALLGVDAALIGTHGAVSEPVAIAMADGARARLAATWAIAITGIAGPGGGTADKPVGTVCFALAGPTGTTATTKKLPDYGRDRVREMAAAVALRMVHDA